MLVFPHWRAQIPDGCRVPQWTPPERFASYIARPLVLPQHVPQYEEDESTGGSSPEPTTEEGSVCEWRGCGAQFSSVAGLSAHVARYHAHPHRDGLFYCGWRSCTRPQRGFNARYKMLVHVRTHTNERPHKCNQCEKSFSRAENLKIHLRSHSGEKPYVCPYEGCGKAYSNSSDRFKHTRTHTVDKPYFCKVPGCNKRYTDPSSLRKHVKTYKHFTPKDTPRMDSSDEIPSPERSPAKEPMYQRVTSPIRVPTIVYSPSRYDISPVTSYSHETAKEPRYPMEQAYMPPEPTMYALRVPSYEMSYAEYSQMYEHAYRSYYTPRVEYSGEVDKKFTETEEDEEIEVERCTPMEVIENLPLNLKCSSTLECKPIEDLIRRDMPLDLSTKS